VTVATLGYGGSVTLAFDDVVIEDRPGPDFLVFENAFFDVRVVPLPGSPDDDFRVFVEPVLVEVSADGLEWQAFAYDPAALAAASDVDYVERALWLQLVGLAGVTPTFTGNWTVANDPAVFDPAGTGGVSGAGGDAFDLADVGLAQARFVRLTDLDTRNGFPGSGEGADVDSVVVLHGRPIPPVAPDSDGDGLSDREEDTLYGSAADDPDSDGDGTDDGREVAGCRDPTSFDTAPWHHLEPRLWLVDVGPCEEVRWTFLGTGVTYDLVRGTVAELSQSAVGVDLGVVECLVSGASSPRWSCDTGTPPPGDVRFYVVRAQGSGDYGRSSELRPRFAAAGCP
jgi:hypothetical protein